MAAKQYLKYLILILLLVFWIFCLLQAGCRAKEPEDVNEPNYIIQFGDKTVDYDDFVVEPNSEIFTFTYSDSDKEAKKVEFYIDSNGLIAIRYENCTPKEGAKFVQWVSEWYWGNND